MRILIILAVLISSFLSGKSVPDESALTGRWGYVANELVFMKEQGQAADKAEVDRLLKAMGASSTNLVLSFSEGHKCRLKLGEKSVGLSWTIDRDAKEFKTKFGVFTFTGKIVRDGDNIVLVYSRKDLFMIMSYLCNQEGRKQMDPLGKQLDSCKGQTIAMIFKKL